jgi:hypothetical protein
VDAAFFLEQLIVVNGLLLGFSMTPLQQLAMSHEKEGTAPDHGHEQAYWWNLTATSLLLISLVWGLFTLQASGRWEGQPLTAVPPLLTYASYAWPLLLLAGILSFLGSIAALAWRHRPRVQIITFIVIAVVAVTVVLTIFFLSGL